MPRRFCRCWTFANTRPSASRFDVADLAARYLAAVEKLPPQSIQCLDSEHPSVRFVHFSSKEETHE